MQQLTNYKGYCYRTLAPAHLIVAPLNWPKIIAITLHMSYFDLNFWTFIRICTIVLLHLQVYIMTRVLVEDTDYVRTIIKYKFSRT